MLKTTKFRFTDVFRPTSIQSCNLWISADSLALNDGDSVSSWTDLSGNNNNPVQVTAQYKPTYKTNIINGKPSLLFDGANTRMSGPNITGSTCFIVGKYTESTSAFQNYDGAFTLHPNFPVFTGTNGTSNWDQALGTYYVNDVQTNTLNLANPFISYVVATQAVANRIGPIRVGIDRDYTYLNRYWYGYISEIISYSNTLTADQILSVRTYLNKKYATF